MTAHYNERPWRVDDTNKRSIHAVVTELSYDAHPMIGVMDTPQLAAEVVSAHNTRVNKTVNRSSYAQKEQFIADLNTVLETWQTHKNLEEAILTVTGGGDRSKRLYDAIGMSADILGPDADLPRIVAHAIGMIRNN